MSQEHRHLTTEQLSAFIDNQLAAEEQGQVDEHLKQCEQCQLWLGELRQTARLVHALPQPQLPRSFTLSADVLVAPKPISKEQEPILRGQVSHVATARRHGRSRVRAAISAISTLAAVVGIAFLLSGITPFSHSSSSSTASAGSASSSSSGSITSRQAQQAETPRLMVTTTPGFMATTIIQATPRVAIPQPTANKPMQPYNPSQSAPTQTEPPSVSLFDLSQAAGRLAIGAILLVLAFIGFISLYLQRHLSVTPTRS